MNIGPIIRAMNHNRTRAVLIILEIAMTLAIVTNCVNVILAERAKMMKQSGFDDDNILWMRARPFAPEFRELSYIGNTIDADLRTISAIPGVRAVANTTFQLWEGGGSSALMKAAGGRAAGQQTQIYYATSDIVQALGARVSEGRVFRAGDHGIGNQPDPGNLVLVTRATADALFPVGGAVGKAIQFATDDGGTDGEPMTVVGVIDTFFNPYGRSTDTSIGIGERAVFVASRAGSYERGMRYLIRTEPGALNSVAADVEKRLLAANPGRAIEFKLTPDKKELWFAGGRMTVTVMTLIIVALVAVTALGLLGLTSLAVAERTKQIGTRRALGATRGDILSLFLVENWLVTTAGLVLGVAGAYALNFLLVSHVSDVKMQWQLLASGMVLLWINGLLSTLPPAMRAMAVSPSIATRSV